MNNKSTLRIALLITIASIATVAFAIIAGQIDDFENGTAQGWNEGSQSPNKPSNKSSGGPQGASDNYLRNDSSGGSGAGSNMVMFNRQQWSGNYNAEQVESLRMWLINKGTTAMKIRVAVASGSTWFSTSTPFNLPADNVWREATFNLNASEMTRVQGTASIGSVLNSVTELRILSSNAPDFRGDAMVAALGVDDIEAVFVQPEPNVFLDLYSAGDVNGNNNTDLGVLQRESASDMNKLFVIDGGSGSVVKTVSYGAEQPVGYYATVPDGTGDLIPEFAVLLQGSLFARVKDVVSNSGFGSPKFSAGINPVALLALDDIGGGVGPELAVVGRNSSNGRVQAQIKDVASGALVRTISFNKPFEPFAAAVVDNVGDSAAQEIAVLGIDAGGRIQAQVIDSMTGVQISKFKFDKNFTPLAFAAVPNTGGRLKYLAVLGINASGVIQAQIRRAANGSQIGKIKFAKAYAPKAFLSFVDSNGSGGGEITVVGVNGSGAIRAQTREIEDGSSVTNITFNKKYPLVDAIAVNGVAGTGRNEIAVLGQKESGEFRLQIKDLLSGASVNTIPLP